MNSTWSSTDPNAKKPAQIDAMKKIKWIKIEVKEVSGTQITMSQTYHYDNGTESSQQSLSGDVKYQYLNFIIPSDLNKGDMIPRFITINGTAQLTYIGMNRNVTYAKYVMSFFSINVAQNMYWDRSTGILCEMNAESSIKAQNYTTTTSTSMMIIETDLWKIVTQISCSASKDTITEGSSLLVSGQIDSDLPGKTVTLTYRKPRWLYS